jgi:hypothetical protein
MQTTAYPVLCTEYATDSTHRNAPFLTRTVQQASF